MVCPPHIRGSHRLLCQQTEQGNLLFSPQLFHVCSVFLMLLCPKVFYIFYENEETLDKGVKSGLDLQRYIHEEVLKLKYHHHHCHHFIFNIIINLMKFRLELDQQTLNTLQASLKVREGFKSFLQNPSAGGKKKSPSPSAPYCHCHCDVSAIPELASRQND